MCVCVCVCVHMILMYVLSLRHYFFELIVTLSNVHCLSSLSPHLEFIASTGEWVLVDVVTNRQRAIDGILTTVYTCVHEYAKQYMKTCHKQLVVQSTVLLTASM